jgi:hypothetical protein
MKPMTTEELRENWLEIRGEMEKLIPDPLPKKGEYKTIGRMSELWPKYSTDQQASCIQALGEVISERGCKLVSGKNDPDLLECMR